MKELAIENLHQIKSLLARIARGDYGKTHKILSGASIGQHVRHILEFYIALLRGMEGGTVCYDERERDMLLETNIDFAMKTIDMIVGKINNFSDDIPVQFKAKYKGGGEHHVLTSSAFRELAYCVEHSIHHQAIIKSGLVAINKQKLVDENFGVAYSTINYRKNVCAQ